MNFVNFPTVIVLVGIPGSGKTKFRNEYIEQHPDFTYINPDEIRQEVTGDISNNSKEARVWFLVYNRLQEYIDLGRNIIFDATNINPKTRRQIEQIAKDKENCYIYYKIFDISPAEAKERIKIDIENGINRSNVPDDVIDRMYENFIKQKDYIIKGRTCII